jgi:hypothetical protein
LRLQIQKRGERRAKVQPEFTQVGERIIGSTAWLGADGHRHERFQVLTIRNGKIVDMQGCASRRPDDSFAASPLDEDEYPTEASARASVSARNGLVRGANVPRPGLSETLSVRPRGENSIQGGGG